MLLGLLAGCPPATGPSLGTNAVEVRVTAEDGTTTKTYSVAVDRGILVPDEIAKIQDAMDAASDGGLVLVLAGTYPENIAFPTNQSITVRSTHGADITTIDGGGNGSVVTFSPTIESMVLDGFTITNGNNGLGGGGIYCDGASPTITSCTISANSSPLNPVGNGGEMYNVNASPTVTNCTFVNGPPSMYNEIQTSPVVTNCIFGEGYISDHMIVSSANSSPVVTYSAFGADEAPLPAGAGNIGIADPLFVDKAAGDFHLQASSPCIDAGDNSAPALPATDTDIDGDGRIINGKVDMGVDETYRAAGGSTVTHPNEVVWNLAQFFLGNVLRL